MSKDNAGGDATQRSAPGSAPTIPGKEAKEKKPKEKKEPTVRRSKFEVLYPGRSTIKVLVDKNPKKEGSKSRTRFDGYTGAKTVADALKNGVWYQDIAYDIGRRFIEITVIADPVPAAPAAPAAPAK